MVVSVVSSENRAGIFEAPVLVARQASPLGEPPHRRGMTDSKNNSLGGFDSNRSRRTSAS